MSQPSAEVLSAIIGAGKGILQTKYTYFGAYTVAVYDHLITLDLEIEHVWTRSFNAVTVLFFLNRYYFLFAASMFLFVFMDPVVNTAVIEDMRTNGVVPSNRHWHHSVSLAEFRHSITYIRIVRKEQSACTCSLHVLYILAEIGLSLWGDLTPSASRINTFAALGYPEISNLPAMRFCVAQLSPKLTGIETSLGQIMQSIFDTVALTLILVIARKRTSGGLVTLIVKQGLVYYILNMATYLTWTLMLIFAPASINQIMGGPALLFACVAVNRLTLHLKSYSPESDSDIEDTHESLSIAFAEPPPPRNRARRRNSWLGASTLEMPVIHREDPESALEMRDIPRDTSSTLYHNSQRPRAESTDFSMN